MRKKLNNLFFLKMLLVLSFFLFNAIFLSCMTVVSTKGIPSGNLLSGNSALTKNYKAEGGWNTANANYNDYTKFDLTYKNRKINGGIAFSYIDKE